MLIKLVEVLPKFEYDRQQGSFRGWLKTVTQRELVTFARERSRKKVHEAEQSFFEDVAAIDELVSGLQEQSESLLRGLQAAMSEVQQACQGEELKSWEAFRRIMLERQELGTVAADLGLTYHAAAMRVQRIKKKIRDRALRLTSASDDDV